LRFIHADVAESHDGSVLLLTLVIDKSTYHVNVIARTYALFFHEFPRDEQLRMQHAEFVIAWILESYGAYG